MNFAATPAQEALRQAARRLAAEHLAPHAAAREAAHQIAPETIGRLAEAGLLGVNVPAELGGLGAGCVAYVLALREVAAADAAVAVTMAVSNMVAEVLTRFGTAAQRAALVPALTSGTMFAGAFALSEAEAGSDAASLSCRAERRGDGFVLSGQKLWITSGDQAGVLVVWARTGDAGAHGISAFVVPAATPGVSCGRPEQKMGLRASHTVSVNFDAVALPSTALLGALGGGFSIAMAALDGGRIGIGAQAAGMGRAALEAACAHVAAHGDPQQAARALAECACELDAGWLLTCRAAQLKDRGAKVKEAAAQAKLYASEGANRCIRRALDVVGPAAAHPPSVLERLFRDCRVTQVYEGTSEIQRLVISRELLRAVAGP